MQYILRNFTKNLKKLRKHFGYSQRELGLLIGVSDKLIWAYESGYVIPQLDRVSQLAQVFGVSITKLAYGIITERDILLGQVDTHLKSIGNLLKGLDKMK